MRFSGKVLSAGVCLFLNFSLPIAAPCRAAPFPGNSPADGLSAQSENSVSTAAVKNPVVRPGENPLLLNISKDARDSRVALDYSLRWDFSDLSSFRPGVKALYSIFKTASSWDITENTRLKYYGFKTNPWRVFIAKERPPKEDGGSGGPAVAGQAEYKKHLRLSLSPLVDDFKRNLDENLRDALLNASLKGASSEWTKISEKDKKIFFRDVLSLGVWDTSMPLMKEGKESLEYISK